VDGIEIDQLMDMIRAMVPEKDEPDIIDWHGIYDISFL
jgi:hypothetical protein